MTVTNKDLIASMAMKDTRREALAVNPMSYSEMLINKIVFERELEDE